MKIVCNRKNLANTITIVQKAVSSKTTMEILKCVKLNVTDNTLTVTGYNLDMAIVNSMNVDNVIKSGEIAVDSKTFGDIIKKLPHDFVELEYLKEEQQLLISSDSSRYSIPALLASDYPSLPEVKSESMHNIPQEMLKRMVKETAFAVSQDMTKPILNGVLIEINKEDVSLVSIDGYRLCLSKTPYNNELDESKIIIPGKSLLDVSALLTNSSDEVVGMRFDEKNAIFTINGVTIITRVLQGDFIDYKNLLKHEHTSKVIVNKDELLQRIERASIISSTERNNLIKLSIRENLINMNCNSAIGASSESIQVELEGDCLDIAFNSRYLIEGLKAIQNKEVQVEFTSNVNPGIIKPISDDGNEYTYLLLPVRVSVANA